MEIEFRRPRSSMLERPPYEREAPDWCKVVGWSPTGGTNFRRVVKRELADPTDRESVSLVGASPTVPTISGS